MGTRLALGASGRDLLLMVVRGGLKLAAYGAAIGGVAVVASSWALVRLFDLRDLGVFPFIASTRSWAWSPPPPRSSRPGALPALADGGHTERPGVDVAGHAADAAADNHSPIACGLARDDRTQRLMEMCSRIVAAARVPRRSAKHSRARNAARLDDDGRNR
jgi:hypothetical protein